MKEFPLLTPDELARRAWEAMAGRDAETALCLWQALREQAPGRPDGYVWPIQLLWQSGRLDEADAMAADAAARFAGDPELEVQQAWVATAQQRWELAAERWAAARAHAPERIETYVQGTHALWLSGGLDDAEALAAEGIAGFPDDGDMLIERAWVATARRDWTEALDRWTAVVNARPSYEVARERIAEARDQLGQATTPAMPDIRKTSAADLMLRFESLGERCDFGAVQRYFGVEPLGLLRFAWSKFDALVAALDDRFAVVGTEEDTSFERFGDETIVIMRKYGLIFHTFVNGVNERPPAQREAFRQQQRRRLMFLKDKLIRDLEDPQKIIVYATDDRPSDADAARLFAALRAYGRNTLLYVRPQRADRPAGTIERLDDGLFAGYFPGLIDFVKTNPPYELWRQLCEQTWEAVAR